MTLPNAASYSYDNANRVTQASYGTGWPGFFTPSSSTAYTYDAADNLTLHEGNASLAYNNVNQITMRAGVNYSYDANGNLTSDGQRAYAWDAENRLVGIGYTGNPGQSTGLRYDGLGRRLAIIENNVSTTTETRHLWCGDKLCQARNVNDQVQRRYFDEGEATASGQALAYGIDQLGSIRVVASAATGAELKRYDYTAYGQSLASTGSADTDFRYAGLYYHQPSGLHLANYRAYSARDGRWLSRDPIGEAGGWNLYAYVDGNPVSMIDPYGLFGWADMPSMPQGVVDFGAGMGDVILFGQGQRLRDLFDIGGVDRCSSEYDAGEWAGIAASFATGAAGGLKAAGTKGAGQEFSHWIPNRMGGPRSVMNGNFVSTEVHALSDPFRYRFMPRTWKAGNPMPSRANQQWVRIPDIYKGAGAGDAYGAGGSAMNDCTCSR